MLTTSEDQTELAQMLAQAYKKPLFTQDIMLAPNLFTDKRVLVIDN